MRGGLSGLSGGWRLSGSRSSIEPVSNAFVRWATGKRLTNGLPKQSLYTPPAGPRTAGYSGLDRIYGSMRHQLAVLVLRDLGRVYIRLLKRGNPIFLSNAFS